METEVNKFNQWKVGFRGKKHESENYSKIGWDFLKQESLRTGFPPPQTKLKGKKVEHSKRSQPGCTNKETKNNL